MILEIDKTHRDGNLIEEIHAVVWSEARKQYYITTPSYSIWFDEEFKEMLLKGLGDPMLENTEVFIDYFGIPTIEG